jgi:hypothetical protein
MLRTMTLFCFQTKRPIPTNSNYGQLKARRIEQKHTCSWKPKNGFVRSDSNLSSAGNCPRHYNDPGCNIVIFRIVRCGGELSKCRYGGYSPTLPPGGSKSTDFSKSALIALILESAYLPSILLSISQVGYIRDGSPLGEVDVPDEIFGRSWNT